jgi:hypothetical protein
VVGWFVGVFGFAHPLQAAQLTLAWDWSDSAGRTALFKVERKTGTGGSYKEIGTTAVGVKQYVDTVENDTTYCYRVRASNSSAGDSPYSAEKCDSVPSSTSGTGSTGSVPSGTSGTGSTGSTTGEIIIDNAAAGASDARRTFKGKWCTSSAPNPYGTDSLYNCGGTGDRYTWTPSIPSAGSYDVYVRWTSNSYRSTAVPVYVRYFDGVRNDMVTTSRVLNQQSGGGAWVLHGRYTFNAGTAGYVEVSGENANNSNVSADAVRFVPASGGTTSSTPTQTSTPTGAYSLWSSSTVPAVVTDPDTQAVELGVKFVPSVAGQIIGIRFYKGPENIGNHIGSLWSSTGTRLGQATFTNETASGWQQVNFATPVSVAAGTTYVASYFAPRGKYSYNLNYFTSSYTRSALSVPASGAVGGNGVYRYGSTSGFPSSTWNASNYWVDVVFKPLQ